MNAIKKLHKYCRVCAKVLGQKETSYVCSDSGDVLKVFDIDVTQDDDCIQPKYYCHTCHIIGKRVTIGEKAGVECAIEVFKWTAHEDGNCWVCRGKAGRPKKSTKKRGRPQGIKMASERRVRALSEELVGNNHTRQDIHVHVAFPPS